MYERRHSNGVLCTKIKLILYYFCTNLGVQDSFFMPKFRHKEMRNVFSDEILERIFADKEMQTIPIGTQATAVNVIERILEQIKEERPYASISELFHADE